MGGSAVDVINLRQTITRVLTGQGQRPSPPEFHRKRGVLPTVKRRIRRVRACCPLVVPFPSLAVPFPERISEVVVRAVRPAFGRISPETWCACPSTSSQRWTRTTGLRSIDWSTLYRTSSSILSRSIPSAGSFGWAHRCCPRPRPGRSIQPSVDFTGNVVCVSRFLPAVPYLTQVRQEGAFPHGFTDCDSPETRCPRCP